MVKSGVELDKAVKPTFQEVGKSIRGFKLKISKVKLNGVMKDVCAIDEESTLPLDAKTPFQTLVMSGLEDNEPCYIVVQVMFEDTEGKLNDKVVFITWCSDDANVKRRMLYASSKGEIAKTLQSVGLQDSHVFEIHNTEEANIDAVLSKLVGVKSKPVSFEGRPVSFNNESKTYDFADK
jgi:hypothetical protein